LRDNVEISLNIKTESLVELSFGRFIWILININDLPSLVDFTMFVMHNDVSVFCINTSLYIKNFSSLIHEETILISEHLPPSRSDTGYCSKVAAVTIALDIEAVVLPVVVSDGLCDLIKPELLLSLVLSPSLKNDISSSKHLYNSVEWKL
jgi:hypothetical protein